MTLRPLRNGTLCSIRIGLCAMAVLAAGCSQQGSSEAAAADASVLIEASQNYVTVQNRSGLPLLDVSIAIVPYGPGEFTRLLPRIENTVKREIPLSEFRGRDGTPFNGRVARAKAVRVRAQDAAGKKYEFEVPWRQ